MGAGASAADGRIFCHACGSRTASVEITDKPRCSVCGATDEVEVTDARLPVTSPASAVRALSLGAVAASSSGGQGTSTDVGAPVAMRVESVTVVALERPEDGGLLLRVLPNVVARRQEASNPASGGQGNGSNNSAAGSPAAADGGRPPDSHGLRDADQEEWEVPSEPACDALVSRLKASPHPSETVSGGLCVICAEDIAEIGTPVVTLSCQHVFHEACIRRWLTKRHTCPTCRMELEVDDVRYLRSIGLKEEADALEKVEHERLAREQQQQAAERRRWVESMRRGDPVHFGLTCASCSLTPLVGQCHRCQQCEDCVLCHECYKNREECHVAEHTFAPFGVVTGSQSTSDASAGSGGLLTVLVPSPARLPPSQSDVPAEPQGETAMAAAEVAFAAVRSLALAPLAGGSPSPVSGSSRWASGGGRSARR